ncbi:MAG: hypothetical protein AAFV01_10620 [Bacteroidota bacterium]
MRFAYFTIIVTGLAVGLLAGCDSGAEDPQVLSVVSTNLGDDGALQNGGGLLVRLSAPLDTATLGYRSLTDEGGRLLVGEDGEPPTLLTWPSDIWGVQDAEQVTFDGSPASFWYDPATATLAFFRETTEPNPEGVRGGWQAGTLQFGPELRSIDGLAFGDDDALAIERLPALDFLDLVQAVPNPASFTTAYGRSPDERIIRFVNLPPSSTITLVDPSGGVAATVSSGSMSVADWFAPQDQSGIFTYRVESEAGVAEDRVLVLADTRPDFDE